MPSGDVLISAGITIYPGVRTDRGSIASRSCANNRLSVWQLYSDKDH